MDNPRRYAMVVKHMQKLSDGCENDRENDQEWDDCSSERLRCLFICTFHSLTVFSMSMDTVTGPTPPGTGVENEHTSLADLAMSPTSFPLLLRLIPTSTHTAPGFSLVMRSDLPTADTTMSACSV